MSAFSRNYRGKWLTAVTQAAEFVNTSTLPVTLRQVFYHLVAAQVIENTQTNYQRLSSITAEERRHGNFPRLVDNGREIHRAPVDQDPASAFAAVADWYAQDRAQGQEYQILMISEKRGMVSALRHSFEQYGVSIIGLGGYASQTLLDEVSVQIRRDGRPAVGIYAGDFDPTGQDIPRNFTEGSGPWAHWEQVALTPEQIDQYHLPENPGKSTDSRSAAFEKKHGRLVQVEVDALDPQVLDGLYREAFERFYDTSIFEQIIAEEQQQRELMRRFAATWHDFEGRAA